MKTIRATEVKLEVTLTVEYPEDAKPLNIDDLGKWVQDQLYPWINLPFDRDTRALLKVDVDTFEFGKTIDYQE